jgi:hypothetical protein
LNAYTFWKCFWCDFLCITNHDLIAIGSTILRAFDPITYGSTFLEEIRQLDGVNKWVNVIFFDIFEHGFCEVDEKRLEIVVQGDVWYFHEVDKWGWNWFNKWKKQKSYPTIINIEHLYAIDYKNLVEMLAMFIDQVHKKSGTFYPLKCMTNIL